ncbi:MAG: hypothetical protein K2N52_01985 [Clostridia bacterium]|nr:hypothetical protein [Clostridia bacterium]
MWEMVDHAVLQQDGGYTYGGEGTYDYVDDANCTITFKWTIEEKEVDLSKIDFEYWNGLDVDTLGNQIWQKYDPKDPPQKSGGNFQVRIPNSNLPEGVTSATAVYGESSRKGPGTMTFDFEFTLDSNHKSSTGSNTISYSMDITGQQVPVNWTLTTLKDANGDDVLDDQNVPYYIYVLDVDPTDPVYPYIEYEYYVSDGAGGYTIISGGIEEVIRPASAGGMGASSTTPKTVYVRPVLSSSAPTTNGISDYVLKFSTSGVEYKKETVGTDKDIVDVTAGTTSMTYGGSVTVADIFKATVRNSDGTPGAALNSAFYTVELYDGTTLLTNNLSSFDFSTLDAKTYQLVFEIKSLYEESYALANSGLDFVVKPVELVVPTLKDGVTLTFNGEEQKLADSLQNFDDKYMEFASNSINEARNANPSYKAIINIKDEFVGNYIFVLPTPTAATTKSPARVVLADGEAGTTAELSNGNATATIYWAINKFVLDTTPNSAWSFTKDGATLSYNGVPAGIKALTMGNDPSLIINVAYYDTDGNPLSDVELKGGNKFLVAAYMDPSCADANNIEFKGQAYDPLTGMTTSPQSVYTVPQSGASAILGNIKDFMTGTLLGLPVWAWFLIALALLILLIIIIVVAAKRRKTKEQREEIKAKKEEEKARKEEERQRKEEERQAQKERLEEERRLQKEKLDAERELAKAKQEAELEKIRMQAQMGAGMAGAGMASMAMQQPMQQAQQPMQQQMPQQQPMQQPMQQQPVQQAQDNTLLAEIRAQMAEMRAENRATQAQMQAMQNMQNQQPHYAPQYAPQYAPAPAPAPAAAPAADSNLMTLMEMKLQMSEMKNQQAVAEMKSAQAVAEVKAAQALAEAKAANHQPESHSQQSQQPIIVMAPSSPMGMMNQNAPYSPNYPNYGGYPSVNMGYGMQALPAPQQMMPPYGMMPNYGYPPYGMVPPYGYPPVAMLPQQTYAPAKAEKEEEPVVTSSSQTNPSMTVSQPPYAYPPGAVMTTTTTIDTSRADSKGVKRTAADSADDVSFDVDGFYDPFN